MQRSLLPAICLVMMSACGHHAYNAARGLEGEELPIAIEKLESQGFSIIYPTNGQAHSQCKNEERIVLMNLNKPDFSISLLAELGSCDVKKVIVSKRGFEL